MKKKRVYNGKPVSIDVYNLTIEGRKVRREIIQHPGAAAILAFDEKDKVILVKQHRFPHGYKLKFFRKRMNNRLKTIWRHVGMNPNAGKSSRIQSLF